MRRLPPTGTIEAFLVTSRAGTLTAAADEIGLSVSALSRRIQKLEEHVGRPLFERRHHAFSLTRTGERLLAGVEPAMERIFDTVEDVRGTHRYHVSVGVPPSFASGWLIPRLQQFRDRHPDVELRLDSSGSPRAKLGISVDAVILFADGADTVETQMEPLRRQRAFAVAAPDLVDSRSGLRAALKTLPLLLHSGLPQVLPSWLAEVGLDESPSPRTEMFDDGPMLVAAAESRLGIALVLDDMINFYPGRARLVRPFGEYAETPYSYALATRATSGNARATGWFRDWLIETAAKDALAPDMAAVAA